MNLNLETGKSKEVNELPDNIVDSGSIHETKETEENFDDCTLVEVKEGKWGDVIDGDTIEDVNFDDCEAKKEEMEGEIQVAEYEDDFTDCRKEIKGEYVAEVTCSTDVDISDEEVSVELQKAYDECDDAEDMSQLIENANTSERIEVYNAEVIERSESEETEREFEKKEYVDIQGKVRNEKETLEKQQEIIQKELENQLDKNVSDSLEDVSQNTEIDIDDKIIDESPKMTGENVAHENNTRSDCNESFKGKVLESENHVTTDVGDIEVEKKIDVTEYKPNLKDVEEEQIDKYINMEDVTYPEIKELHKEHFDKLQRKNAERNAIEVKLRSKFDEVLIHDKGSDEYHHLLQEYNDLQDKKALLVEQTTIMEQRHEILDRKRIELREEQIQNGIETIELSVVTLANVDILQARYDQFYYDKKIDKAELIDIRENSCVSIKDLASEKNIIKQAMDAKKDEISEYVISNKMTEYETSLDLRYQQMTAEYNELKACYDRIGYNIVKLDENNIAVSERLGDEYVSFIDFSGVHTPIRDDLGKMLMREERKMGSEVLVVEITRETIEPMIKKEVLNSEEREMLRKAIMNGVIGEKEIRQRGSMVRERYDELIVERNHEFDYLQEKRREIAVKLASNLTDEDRVKINNEIEKLKERELEYQNKYASQDMIKNVLQEFRRVGPAEGDKGQTYEKGLFKSSEQVIESIESIRPFVPTEWLDKSNSIPITTRYVSRGYFNMADGKPTIALSSAGSGMQRCAFHEMGHFYEELYPEIRKLEHEFYNRRTSGEELQWLGSGYSKNEVTRFDNFIDPYMGKDYGNTETSGYELFSMGMESVFAGSYNISRDPEYHNFILGILTTI